MRYKAEHDEYKYCQENAIAAVCAMNKEYQQSAAQSTTKHTGIIDDWDN
jgi:hypothetical protein